MPFDLPVSQPLPHLLSAKDTEEPNNTTASTHLPSLSCELSFTHQPHPCLCLWEDCHLQGRLFPNPAEL